MINPSRTKLVRKIQMKIKYLLIYVQKRTTDESCLLAFLSGLATQCTTTEQLTADSSISLNNHQAMKQRAAEFDCGTLR